MLLVSQPELPPHRCIICDSPSGEMIDLERTHFVRGHGQSRFYFCRNCVIEAAQLVGCAAPEQLQKLKLEASALNEQNLALEQDLVMARANKVVNLDELRDLVGAANARSEDKTKTKPAA